MQVLERFKNVCEALGGYREESSPEAAHRSSDFRLSPLLKGLWWAFLFGVILLFCGQTSKFIYIDF
jgi:hypothetical protein